MIKNDRQYQLTKGHLRAFEEALRDMEHAKRPEDVGPEVFSLHRASLESQRDELCDDIAEYEELRSGKIAHFEALSLEELPVVLIRARIARKLTQKDLADALRLKEQQIQRWEANNYSGASLETLSKLVKALGVEVRQDVFLPARNLTPELFFQNLSKTGIPEELVTERILPDESIVLFESGAPGMGKSFAAGAMMLSRVFGGSPVDFLGATPPTIDVKAVAATRFKIPARVKATAVNAYTVYSHYLAACLVPCMSEAPREALPADWHELHRRLSGPESPITFERALEFAWDCGILVLPLRGKGAFHGAVWSIAERYAIVLKQSVLLESRWLYDLLHELGHIANGHVEAAEAVIEEEPIRPQKHTIREEEEANEWAEDTLFDGESNELEDACRVASEGKLQLLRSVLPKIAGKFNVNLGSLANHLAYRLESEDENWWGAATNLQKDSPNPFEIARNALFRRLNLRRLNSTDRILVMRALSETE